MADVSVDDINVAIAELLREYGDELQGQLEDDIEEASLSARDDLRKTSPKEHGKYARSWEKDWAVDRFGDMRMVIHNVAGGRMSGGRKLPTNIVSLLEEGHMTRSGWEWSGKKHIAPAASRMFDDLRRRLRNG